MPLRKLLYSGSNAQLASLRVDNAVSASQFSGSFFGNGSGLTGIVASATPAGPNQSVQFNDVGSTSGSANFRFDKSGNIVYVTGSVIATSFTGSLFGTASSALEGGGIYGGSGTLAQRHGGGGVITVVRVLTDDVLQFKSENGDNLFIINNTDGAQRIELLDGATQDTTISNGRYTASLNSTSYQFEIREVALLRDLFNNGGLRYAGYYPSITASLRSIPDVGIIRDHLTSSYATTASYYPEIKTFGITIDGGGSTITTGVKGDITIPFACTIDSWYVTADQAGSIVIDVWRDTLANFPPTVADSIAGSEKPTLSGVAFNSDTSLTTFTRSLAANDVIRFNVDSVATVTRVNLVFKAVV